VFLKFILTVPNISNIQKISVKGEFSDLKKITHDLLPNSQVLRNTFHQINV